MYMADSRLASSQWKMSLQSNAVSLLAGRKSRINPVYINLNLVITFPADVLTLDTAGPSAGTVLNEKYEMFSLKFLWLSVTFWHFHRLVTSPKMVVEILQNLKALLMLGCQYNIV